MISSIQGARATAIVRPFSQSLTLWWRPTATAQGAATLSQEQRRNQTGCGDGRSHGKSVHRASRPLPHHRSAAVRAPLALSTLAGLGIPRRLFGASFALTSAKG